MPAHRTYYVENFESQGVFTSLTLSANRREEALVHQKLRDAACIFTLENSASDQSVFGERKTFYDAALSSAFQHARGFFARS